MKCPVCGKDTFDEFEYKYDICSECFWEYDPAQVADPDFEGGANAQSLNQYRAVYLKTKAEKCLIKGVHHIAMKACDEEEYDKVVDFYHNLLKFPIVRTWDSGMMIDLGNTLLEIFNNGETPLESGAIRHFAFATDNVDACVERVTEAGYEVFTEPRDIVIPSDPEFPARIAFCRGPLGEEIEFFQEK